MNTNTRTAFRRTPGGFTLVEVLIAAVLMVLGFTALVAAFGYEGVAIQRGEEITYGTFLANEIHDMALRMDFADVFALDDETYDPARLSTGVTQDRPHYAQQIAVAPVDDQDLSTTVSQGDAQAARVTVTILAYDKRVLTQTYYVFDLSEVPFTDPSGQ